MLAKASRGKRVAHERCLTEDDVSDSYKLILCRDDVGVGPAAETVSNGESVFLLKKIAMLTCPSKQ